MPKIFISYRRQDDPYATHHVYERLESHFGKESLFMDIDDIPFGVDFVEHIDGEVAQCDVLIAVIGDRWLDLFDRARQNGQADFVQIEIRSALRRNIPVIPVLVGQATMPNEQQLPEDLRLLARRNAAEMRPGRDLRDHLNRLVRGIEHWVARLQDTPQRVVKAPTGSEEALDTNELSLIKSPMAGTFYTRPNPDAERYVKVGSRVNHDTTVGLIEAMKVFNEIPAECSGVIVSSDVEDGTSVDNGTVLYKVEVPDREDYQERLIEPTTTQSAVKGHRPPKNESYLFSAPSGWLIEELANNAP